MTRQHCINLLLLARRSFGLMTKGLRRLVLVSQVSHDEHLITGSVDELWVVSEGRVTPFSGTFKDYKKMVK